MCFISHPENGRLSVQASSRTEGIRQSFWQTRNLAKNRSYRLKFHRDQHKFLKGVYSQNFILFFLRRPQSLLLIAQTDQIKFIYTDGQSIFFNHISNHINKYLAIISSTESDQMTGYHSKSALTISNAIKIPLLNCVRFSTTLTEMDQISKTSKLFYCLIHLNVLLIG